MLSPMHLAAGIATVLLLALVVAGATAAVQRDRGTRLALLGIAVAARLAVGAVVWIALARSGRDWMFADELEYLLSARGTHPEPLFYGEILRLVADIAGPSSWLPRVQNVILGAAVAPLAFEIARRLKGRNAGLVAGVASALWPSLCLWSVLVMKDALVISAGLAVVLALMVLVERSSSRPSFLVVAAGGLALVYLRDWTYLVLMGTVTTLFALEAFTRRRRAALASLALLMATLGAIGAVTGLGFLGSGRVSEVATADEVMGRRIEGAAGETGFGPAKRLIEADREGSREGRTLRAVIEGTPAGLLNTLFGPFPWQPSAGRALVIFEFPFWLLAAAGAAFACVRAWRGLLGEWGPPVIFMGGVIVVMAVYVANSGTALRLRGTVIPIALATGATLIEGSRAQERVKDWWSRQVWAERVRIRSAPAAGLLTSPHVEGRPQA
jgi:hypothetical protein